MVRIALAQINPTVGDIKGNESKIIKAIEDASRNSAEVVVFPELVVTGYPPEDLLLKKSFILAAQKSLDNIAARTGSIYAIVGTPIFKDGKLYNGAAVCKSGELLYTILKFHLPNYGVFDEKRYFSAGENRNPVEIGGVGTAVTICEDCWVSEGPPANLCAMPGVKLIINLSSSPFHIGKTEERRNIMKSWASRFKKPLVFCNLVGGQDELVFDGGSFVCDAHGEVIAAASEFKEDLLVAEVPAEEAGVETAANRITATLPYPEIVFEALKFGIRDYVGKNGFKKVLIALSGGIDSALTASIAVAALGAKRVEGVALPSRYSSPSSLDDAKELADNLGISLDVIPITEPMEAFDKSLASLFRETEPGLAEENIQARIRGTLMMAISNKFGHLVLATGNKSEMGVGYCTLYGDMAGGFAVINDLPKLKVYELANWINRQKELPKIPRSTIKKEPSAELRPNQKDSDSLPEYAILDPILKLYVEDEKSIEEITSLGYIVQDVEKVAKLVNLNEYKRRQAAPGVKITPKAFGKDRRMPITNNFIEDVR